MSLEGKVELTKAVLHQVLHEHGPRRTAVAWTAGKDSTVVLWLWRLVLLEGGHGQALAVNLDTGAEFPEVMALRDSLAEKWCLALHVRIPEVDLSNYSLAADKLECCRDLKIMPLQRALVQLDIRALLTGLRRDEHPERAGRDPLEVRRNPDYVQVNPILDWTEMDVWAFTIEQGLPYCPLYDQGYRSLGCMPCTRTVDALEQDGERRGRDQEKERRLEMLRGMGYF
jgi:phosphoadenosine phosphosulfate reductase